MRIENAVFTVPIGNKQIPMDWRWLTPEQKWATAVRFKTTVQALECYFANLETLRNAVIQQLRNELHATTQISFG